MEDLNFNLVVIIVFLVIGAIRWVLENMSGKKPPAEPQHWEEYDYEERDYNQQQPNSLEDLYEEARREIQERQNRNIPQPEVIEEKLSEYRTSAPAPPPLPPTPGKARINRPAPPRKEETPNAYAQASDKRPTLTAEQKKAAAAFQQLGKKDKKAARPQSRVKELLATPSAARDAIVLAEILGPPKGIR